MITFITKPLDWLYEQSAKSIFFLSCLIVLLMTIIQQEYIFTDTLYYKNFSEQMAEDRILQMIDSKEKYWWVSYISVPITLVIQIFAITICVNIGTLLAKIKITYKGIASIVIKGIFCYSLLHLILLYTGYVFIELESFRDLNKLNFYSMSSIFVSYKLPYWLDTVMSYLNIMECFFISTAAYGFKPYFNSIYIDALNFVIINYTIGLFMWVVVILFLITSF